MINSQMLLDTVGAEGLWRVHDTAVDQDVQRQPLAQKGLCSLSTAVGVVEIQL